MKIIFLPLNFPGPFRYTAAELAADKSNKVIFITDRSRRDVRIPGVRRILISIPPLPHITDRSEVEATRSIRRGAQIANALVHLRNSGFTPDIIVANAGHGCSLYVKDIFPNAFLAIYADSYQSNSSMLTTLKPNNAYPTVNFSPDRVRNLFQWNALSEGQMTFTSTEWQKSLYPEDMASQIKVLHEGIDTAFFSPQEGQKFNIEGCDLSHVDELVTFSGRSIDTRKSFPQFLHSIPQILDARPNCHVLVMSDSHDQAEGKDSWQNLLQEKYAVDLRRVHFIGFRPYKDYRMMLQASTVHVFLTTPQALSTGLFESMSCGCLVVGGDTAPVREVIDHGKNGFLYDLWDSNNLAQTIVGVVESAPQMQSLRDAARQTICKHYDSHKQTKKNVKEILKEYANFMEKNS